MTSTSITGDGRSAIEKKIGISNVQNFQNISDDWESVFEIERCLHWIKTNSFKQICLQFPDEYLSHSPKVLKKLEICSGQRCYILADSTYGSCCVDEKTAQHVPQADCLIHFGQSCLTPCSQRLPVLYIFTKPDLDVQNVAKVFKENFPSEEEKIVILYDVIYQHTANALYTSVQDKYPSLKLSELVIPGNSEISPSKNIIKHSRSIPIPPEEQNSYKMFFLGSRSLPNLLLSLPFSTFKVYDPILSSNEQVSTQTSEINKLIRKRNFYIEKVKDSSSIGILVGTLVLKNYLDAIERLKTIFRKVGKKFYVVSIGEINPCKLGNFMDIDCFVFVGCPEVLHYYISDEAKGQFFQPIVTPYDVELAFCSGDEDLKLLGQDYVIDWTFLVEKGPPEVKDLEDDVSLITGGMRQTLMKGDEGNNVVNWLGLDVNEDSPSRDVTQVHQGRSGIASNYVDEPVVQ